MSTRNEWGFGHLVPVHTAAKWLGIPQEELEAAVRDGRLQVVDDPELRNPYVLGDWLGAELDRREAEQQKKVPEDLSPIVDRIRPVN
jgi:hypothetical protein